MRVSTCATRPPQRLCCRFAMTSIPSTAFHFFIRTIAPALLVTLLSGAAWSGKANNTLNVAFPREVVTLDGLYSNLRENDILSLVVDDALYTVDPRTLQPVPLAAASHKVIDDRTIDVELRRGVKFHDGSEMTAEDVVYSYNWIIN